MSKKADIITSILLILMILVGISVMCYPMFSNWWNQNKASHVISNYQDAVAHLDDEDYEKYFIRAREYNKQIYELDNPFTEYDRVRGYESFLDVTGTGIMGFISIPAIRVELPVYHGTSEGVLNIAVGHMEGSSLPVGGENTHAVLSGHRGLPSAKLFTDLDKIVVGDYFTLNILNEVLTYEVEDINIVEPDDMEKIRIVPQTDKVTLVTCTPYGVNTHRLLIRSKRIETEAEKIAVKVSSDAVQADMFLSVPIIAFPFLLLLLIFWAISGKVRGKRIAVLEDYKVRQNYKKKFR